ncbi:MAG TPA: WYL domain-containing protein [Thermoleptolyngbya sp. M55_K2018_002]|nr:WYL domain-containing protein [Thermoleptolyngbya sp. M55_K2018_002]
MYPFFNHATKPYQIELPGRSLNEFLRWLNRFMHCVQILKPEALAQQHRANAAALLDLYDRKNVESY